LGKVQNAGFWEMNADQHEKPRNKTGGRAKLLLPYRGQRKKTKKGIAARTRGGECENTGR